MLADYLSFAGIFSIDTNTICQGLGGIFYNLYLHPDYMAIIGYALQNIRKFVFGEMLPWHIVLFGISYALIALILELPLLSLRPNIIDFEASGFGVDSYPIEVGVALSTGQKYCALIKPANDWLYWDQRAELVHGLSLDLLWSHGKPISTVTRELNTLLENKTVYSDGWVVDKPWLSRLFYQTGLTPSFFLSSLEYILKEPQMEIWTETQRQVTTELALSRHRASTDALIIQETYARTQQRLLKKNYSQV